MKNKGIFYALGGYFLWGILPIFWKQLHHIPSFQIIPYRVISSLLFLAFVLTVRKDWHNFKKAVLNRKSILLFIFSGLLLGINWTVYIWAVNDNHIVETSLGYFINPLLSVALGMIFLREKLRPMQWVPIILAAIGVIYLTVQYGALPWIALVLALAFGFYGLIKKTAPTGGLYSMTVEMAVLCLPAIGYLLLVNSRGEGVLGTANLTTRLLLIAAGGITVIPMLLFTAGARNIPLTLLGILQYLAPTLQFLIGVLVYREPFTRTDLIGYGIVWAALILFWLEGTLQRRKIATAV
jgi:chloramphenicol-sensitive protein RarD